MADASPVHKLITILGGTGQLISRLTNDEIDVAMCVRYFPILRMHINRGRPSALTDALISGIAKGSKAYKLVGSYVASPLNWYVFWVVKGYPTRTRTLQGRHYWKIFILQLYHGFERHNNRNIPPWKVAGFLLSPQPQLTIPLTAAVRRWLL